MNSLEIHQSQKKEKRKMLIFPGSNSLRVNLSTYPKILLNPRYSTLRVYFIL